MPSILWHEQQQVILKPFDYRPCDAAARAAGSLSRQLSPRMLMVVE